MILYEEDKGHILVVEDGGHNDHSGHSDHNGRIYHSGRSDLSRSDRIWEDRSGPCKIFRRSDRI